MGLVKPQTSRGTWADALVSSWTRWGKGVWVWHVGLAAQPCWCFCPGGPLCALWRKDGITTCQLPQKEIGMTLIYHLPWEEIDMSCTTEGCWHDIYPRKMLHVTYQRWILTCYLPQEIGMTLPQKETDMSCTTWHKIDIKSTIEVNWYDIDHRRFLWYLPQEYIDMSPIMDEYWHVLYYRRLAWHYHRRALT